MGGNQEVISGLTGGQKNINRLMYRFLTGQDPGPVDPDKPNQAQFPSWNQMPMFGNATPYGYRPVGSVGPRPDTAAGAAAGMRAGMAPQYNAIGQNISNTPIGPNTVPPGAQGPEPNWVPGQLNATPNILLQHLQQQMQGLNPIQNFQISEANLRPIMQGQQSRPFSPLQAPAQLRLPTVSAPSPLRLPQQKAGPNLNLPNLQALPSFQFQKQNAAPSLNEATYRNDYRYQDVSAGPQARAERITPDLGYRYDPFAHKDISGSTGQVNNTYDYKPGSVRTTMNNKDFTKNYFEQGVMNPLLRQYDTAIAPRLADQAAAAGNTFSTRANVAKQMALQDLQTQALGELSRVTREDELTRSAQDLQAQQFNVGTGLQNAQFGAGQQLSYDTLNSQRAMQIAMANEANRMGAHQMNTEGTFNEFAQRNQNILQAGSLNNQFGLQAHGMNNQDRQFAQGLNAQGRENQARMANDLATNFAQINTQRGMANQQNAFNFANLNTQGALNAFNSNVQNALGFGGLNTQRQLGAAQLNNQNNQFFAGLNQQGALDAFRANSANALGFGQLNTGNQLAQAQLNNQTGQNYDFFNQQMQTQLAESAMNRQLQANQMVGGQLNDMYSQFGMLGQMGGLLTGLDQAGLDRQYKEFLRMAPENSPFLQLGMQLLGQNQGNMATQNPGVGDQIAGGLGLGVSGLSLLALLGL